MFSPYYARAERRGRGAALDHCALNVALYGAGGKRWALTERRRHVVRREPAALAIGPSAVAWDGDTLVIAIDETTFPLPTRLSGTVRVRPAALCDHAVALDAGGRHRWSPLAASSRVEVELTRPRLSWSGHGYLDSNAGDEPLHRAFAHWHWSRARVGGRTVVLYDLARREGGRLAFALACDDSGRVESLPVPAGASLPRTGWGIERRTLADAGHPARVVATLEDTPFYARSLLATRLAGADAVAVHESLSLDRFRRPWVQALLPFRMPRAWW